MSEEHWKIYNVLDEYYLYNEDPLYKKTYEEKPHNFSSLIFSNCFSEDPEEFCFYNSEFSKPIRFFQEYGNAIRMRCYPQEMNIELNLDQNITPIQKEQLKKSWCKIKNKDNNQKKELFVDIIKPMSEKFHWHEKEDDDIHNYFDNELSYINDMDCNEGIERLVNIFEKVKKGYTYKRRFEIESLTDPYGRSPEELEKRFYESQSLLKFHGDNYY